MAFDVASIFAGGVGGIFTGIKDIIGAFKLDPAVAAANATKLAELEIAIKKAELEAEVALSQAQTKINEIEAGSSDWFVRRARPAAMWVCVVAFAYSGLGLPLLTWFSTLVGITPPPVINTAVQETLLYMMLGVGGMRSFDKMKGTSK